jgi:hypothetical protein
MSTSELPFFAQAAGHDGEMKREILPGLPGK